MLTAYYNENDPFAAAWLRELIKAGHIAPGVVDERSITDVTPADLVGYTQCHFFAGIGVWSYALRQAGWEDERQVWTGSCPCQGFSSAGRALGFSDERHLWPDWQRLIAVCKPHVIFGEQVASADGLAWLDFVCADLETAGYAVGALDTCAAGFGAPHIRNRLYFVANSGRASGYAEQRYESREELGRLTPTQESAGSWECGKAFSLGHPDMPGKDERTPSRQQSVCLEHGTCGGTMGDAEQPRLEGHGGNEHGGDQPRRIRAHEAGSIGATSAVSGFWADADWIYCRGYGTIPPSYRPVEPGTFPLAAGIAARMDKLRGYGNAINAEAAKEFIKAAIEVLT